MRSVEKYINKPVMANFHFAFVKFNSISLVGLSPNSFHNGVKPPNNQMTGK